jgi:hypothetical protein
MMGLILSLLEMIETERLAVMVRVAWLVIRVYSFVILS